MYRWKQRLPELFSTLKLQHLTCRKKDGDVEKKNEKEDDMKEDENNNNN